MSLFGNPDRFLSEKHKDEIEEIQHRHQLELSKRQREFDEMDARHELNYDTLQQKSKRQEVLHEARVNNLTEAHSIEKERMQREHEDRVSDLTDQLSAQEALGHSHSENVNNAAQLDAERTVFEADKAAFGDVKTAVRVARDEGRSQAEAEYNRGYGDGLADGIRKGVDSTAGDREELIKFAHKTIDTYKPAQLPASVAPDLVIVSGGEAKRTSKKDKND